MSRLWKLVKAFFRLDLQVVCEMSDDLTDFHDYPDSRENQPLHFYLYTCKRCGKEFTI